MLDKALRGEFSREEALLYFGEMYATAVAGDGSAGRRLVELAVGGELGRGAVLLRLATLHLLNQLLPKELKFNARIYVGEGRYYNITATGENAARFKRLLAVTASSAGGEYLSPKFDQFVEEARVEVRLDKDSIRGTKGGGAADLTISVSGVAVTYTVYLSEAITLIYTSTDRSRAELAALLLKLAGVDAAVWKGGGTGVWYVKATTDMIAAGREELRKAIAEIVKKAVEKRLVEAGKAERWLKKLEGGLTLEEGWPKYNIMLFKGVPVIRFGSISRDNIEQVAQRLEKMGLKRGVHFSVTTPEGGKVGYVRILKEGLAYAAYLSVHGNKEAAKFVEFILQRAEEKGKEVHEEFLKVVNEGKAWGSLELKGFVKEFEVDGKKYVVKVIGGGAEFDEGRSDKKILRIRITAEVSRVEGGHIVDRVVREYTITFGRYGAKNETRSFVHTRADAPGGKEADAERLAAVIEALTGVKPKVYRKSDGDIEIVCSREHLEGFMRYKELADAIMRWLEETSRR
jgi:23S rRNA pseudoU1915 N3-methylase RlmH